VLMSAIAKANMLFSERGHRFDGFEVWDRARVLMRRPDPFAICPSLMK
jgi:hypothetical protein